MPSQKIHNHAQIHHPQALSVTMQLTREWENWPRKPSLLSSLPHSCAFRDVFGRKLPRRLRMVEA
jgi:hypothetical protein